MFITNNQISAIYAILRDVVLFSKTHSINTSIDGPPITNQFIEVIGASIQLTLETIRAVGLAIVRYGKMYGSSERRGKLKFLVGDLFVV
jgi:hypothetical protein